MKKEKTPIPYSNKLKLINDRYPKTSDTIMKRIFDFDHKYYEYLLKLYHYRNKPYANTFYAYMNLVKEFDELLPYINVDERDIYHTKYLDPKYLNETVKKYREIRDEKKFQSELSKHATKLIDTDYYTVLHIHTPEAGERYGRGTKWCITNHGTFDSYFKSNYIFYIIFKQTDEKYAVLSSKSSITLELNSIWNKHDNRVEKKSLYQVSNEEVDMYERFNCLLECFAKFEIVVFQEYEKRNKRLKVDSVIKQLNSINLEGLEFLVDEEQQKMLNQSISEFVDRLKLKKKDLFSFDNK